MTHHDDLVSRVVCSYYDFHVCSLARSFSRFLSLSLSFLHSLLSWLVLIALATLFDPCCALFFICLFDAMFFSPCINMFIKPCGLRFYSLPATIASVLRSFEARSHSLANRQEVDVVHGWIRTVRLQKNVAFAELSDGSLLKGLQIVMAPELATE